MINNNNNDINNTNSSRNNYKINKEPIIKGKQKFLNYHLSYVPLNYLNNNKEETIKYNSLKNDSIENTYSSQFQIPIHSSYSSKETTKSNTIKNKMNSRNYLTISDSNNIGYNLKTFKSLSENEKIINKKNNILKKIENEKYKGNIKEKIKDFYNQMKSKGCLSYLTNAENNMFFLRKFNKKYISAIKKNKFYKTNKETNINKTIEGNQGEKLPEIKECKNCE